MDRAVRSWSAKQVRDRAEIIRLGYFGSYARGDWGVGSDIDLIAIVERSAEPFERRALAWDLLDLPVPAALVVYTRKEWDRMCREGGRFVRTINREAVWVVGEKSPGQPS